jgi:hypothetical protein
VTHDPDRILTMTQRDLDQLVSRAYQTAAQQAVNAVSQHIADATVKALRDAGWLKTAPSQAVTVKRVVRDEAGRITAVVEGIEDRDNAPGAEATREAVLSVTASPKPERRARAASKPSSVRKAAMGAVALGHVTEAQLARGIKR